MPQWTKEQLAAIQARNSQLLVSAAAGSGKTAVLVERIVDLISRDGLSLDRMLIVTFTNAAASEMRERIQFRLAAAGKAGDQRMDEQLDKLELCQIGTIHGFCQQVIRQYFQAVGLDPQARLCDPAQGNAMFAQAIEDALIQCYEQEHPDFLYLADCFEQRELTEIMDSLYHFLMSLPNPFEWLENATDAPPDKEGLLTHPWVNHVMEQVDLLLLGVDDMLSAMEAALNEPNALPQFAATLDSDRNGMEGIKQARELGLEALTQAVSSVSYMRAPTVRKPSPEEEAWKDRFNNVLRKGLKDIVKSMLDLLPDLDGAARDLQAMAPAMAGLNALMNTLHQIFSQEKQDQNLVDFNDLEHFTLKILSQPDLRKEIAGSFDEIFVDEYQDVSSIQQAIVQAVHDENNRIFMVGDVKQSIYRFRLADPTLFLNCLDEFSSAEDAPKRKIILQKNFRSQPTVLGAVNQVFARIMDRRVTEIDYDQDAALVPGRLIDEKDLADEGLLQSRLATELHLMEAPVSGDVDGLTKYGQEAALAAKLIVQQMSTPIADQRTGQTRLPTYKDIAILVPKMKTVGAQIGAALKDAGIPYFADGDEEYFSLPEIDAMMQLLHTLDNPYQDLPLLSTLRLPMLDFTEVELAKIRLCLQGKNVPFYRAFEAGQDMETTLGEKCRKASKTLGEWRFLKDNLPLSTLLWRLLTKTGMYRRAGALPGGAARQANLRLLCRRGQEYEESTGGGLSGFLKQNESMRTAQDKRSAKLLGEKEDLVRLMTIHKSKGLEFPIVILLGLSDAIDIRQQGKVFYHAKLGLALPYVNPDLRITRKSFSGKAIQSLRKMEERAERARLLYVAMTRAREKLYMIGTVTRWPQDNWFAKASPYQILSANSLLDWICQAVWENGEIPPQTVKNPDFSTDEIEIFGNFRNLCTQSTGYPQGSTPWKIKGWGRDVHSVVEKEQNFHSLISALETVGSEPVDPLIARLLASREAQPPAPLPLKTSVTALLKSQLFQDTLTSFGQEEESRETKAQEETIVSPLTISPLPRLPSFLDETSKDATLTGAQRGTAVHGALSGLDYPPLLSLTGQALKNAVIAQLDSLLSQGILTYPQRQAVPLAWIIGFLESPIGKRAQNAAVIRREWAFNLRLASNMPTLVQGVIDLCFQEPEGWVLVDYKTDYIQDKNAFFLRYGPQLALYRRAITEILDQPVKETWLFALRDRQGYRLGDAIP